ncbi:MAG TPA: CPBP family intramembrane glutamic endopeptidase, partial [Candidatus Binatia bacterium]|nr:CPBP family intramembrane glutamic endopeptidase [Candidatus Binatia bacterium]
ATGLMAHEGAPPFYRFVSRSLQIVALVGLWPLLRFFRIDSWKAVGLQRAPDWQKQLRSGFCLGLVSLGFVGAAALISGARVWDSHLRLISVVSGLAGAVVSAIIVALLEETLFRGVIFGALRQFNHWVTALAISSAVYSLVHFFEKPSVIAADIKWSSGLELLPQMLSGLADVDRLVPAFFVVLLLGAILGVAYQRTGSLYYSIGLHAGWIFWLKSFGVLTANHGSAMTHLWGSAKMIDGWFTVLVLLPILAWFLFSPTSDKPVTVLLGRFGNRPHDWNRA